MKSINLSAQDIEAFLALRQAAHFTRAAEQCHLSQSAFSQRIRRIESMAGVRLFARSTRHVTLTPEGELLAVELERIAQDLQQALARLKDLASLRSGRVAVAALPSVAAVWMPGVIAACRQAYPQVALSLFDTLAEPGLAMLRAGQVDFAITAGGDWREFQVRELRSERYCLVCRDDHPLAALPGVTLAQLQGVELVHLARSSSVRQHLEALPEAQRLRGSGLEVEHLATAAALVAQGLGVTVVPELTLFHFSQPGLKIVPVTDAALRRPVVLAHRKDRALSVAARAVVDLVLAATGPQGVAVRPPRSG